MCGMHFKRVFGLLMGCCNVVATCHVLCMAQCVLTFDPDPPKNTLSGPLFPTERRLAT